MLFYKFNQGFRWFTLKYTRGVKGWIKGAPLVVILLVCLIVGDIFLFKSKWAIGPTLMLSHLWLSSGHCFGWVLAI